MKKRFLSIAALFACLLLGAISANAQHGNEMQVIFSIDDVPSAPGHGKGPVLMPTLWQDGYLLDFHGTHADYVLRLVDATGAVVYSVSVPSYQMQVWLPATLSGTYELQLYGGGAYYFYAEITL